MASHNVPEKFKAWAAMDQEAGKKLEVVPWEYTPKKWTEEDVDIKVEASSICGSCIHTITSGWGAAKYPCVVGHEIVGEVVRAGKNSGREVGQRVGVGAQAGSCRECENCKAGLESYCPKMVGTYQGTWPEDQGEGRHQQGGYGLYHRTRGYFAVPVPDGLDSFIAAPMMCGGVTVYSPLKRHGAGPGKKVAIVGIGGLGHFGLIFSNALGADTYAISHSDSKKEDCVSKMGLKPENFIVSHDPKQMLKDNKAKFDLIVVTNNQAQPPVAEYLGMCKTFGTVCFVGLSEEKLPQLPPTSLVKGVKLTGSMIGSPHEIAEMLQLAHDQKLHSIIQKRPMKETGAALKDMQDGKARYRYVLDAADSGL